MIPPAVLTDLQSMLLSTLTDSVTNARTTLTTACRVRDGANDVRLPIPGLPHHLRLREMLLREPPGADTLQGDVLTITGHVSGVYVALEAMGDTTNQVAQDTRICLRDGNGDGQDLPIVGNATVTFRMPAKPFFNTAPNTVTVRAWLFMPTAEDVQLYGLDPGFKWGVVTGPALTLPDGTHIDDGIEIRSADVLGIKSDGTPRKATLSKTHRSFGPLAVNISFFTEPV